MKKPFLYAWEIHLFAHEIFWCEMVWVQIYGAKESYRLKRRIERMKARLERMKSDA